MQDRKYVWIFQAWDYSWFEVLYEKYIDLIFAYIYRKTSDREVAEDLCSQVWIKVLKSLEFFWERDNANFKSWLYRIAKNTVIDHYRCRKEKVSIDEIVEVWISSDFAKELDIKGQLVKAVDYMQTLKPLEREVLTLRIWDDLSYKHISKLVDRKEVTCKKIFSRGVEKLRANISLIIVLLLVL